ncbi:hypothetical protein [Mycobacterium sp. URHB0044]|jgi:hypothetical protein|uniref:hypothetical protein n=1 Tax=Mycobacterium sp. URHB0044 TaxID=1380386 RepID=UPI0012DD48A8|nr:hypothetical protein [Mycobacterium sp. URHB0044]
MTITSASMTETLPILEIEDTSDPTGIITVYTCSRLGRTANPPSRGFGDWFRFGRRR